jgi:site-specific recombinase XerD
MGNKNLHEGEVRLYPTHPEKRNLVTTWFVKWYVNGRLKHLNVPNLKNLEEKNKAAIALIARVKANPVNPSLKKEVVHSTVATEKIFAAITERAKMRGLEKKTVQSYESHVRNLNNFCKANGFRTVNVDAAKSFIAYMIDKDYHPTTINNHRRTFATFFKTLKKEKEVRKNPFEDIDKIMGEADTRSHFTDSQLQKVKKALLDKGMFNIETACKYLYYLLCRPKELRFVKIQDVNFEEWTVRITWRIGKSNRKRYIIIPDSLKEWMIENNIESYPLNYYLCGKKGFPSEMPVGINYWSGHLTSILRELNFDETYVLYSIKNTGAIKWYKATKDLVSLQRQIGHQDPKTTTIYLRSLGVMDFDHVRSLIPAF